MTNPLKQNHAQQKYTSQVFHSLAFFVGGRPAAHPSVGIFYEDDGE